MDPPTNIPWRPPAAGLPPKPKPPMFAYAKLPPKPVTPRTAEDFGSATMSSTDAATGPNKSPRSRRRVRSRENDGSTAPFQAPVSAPAVPSRSSPSPSSSRATPAPGPGALVPYADSNPLPTAVGRATINMWPRSVPAGQEKDGFSVAKRARSEDDLGSKREEEFNIFKRDDDKDEDGPVTPLSLRVTRTVDITPYDPHDTGPVPVLPPPLPSKRAKKGGASTAVLLPVEKLPVFPLPPLPPIRDAEILKQVFTHQSVFPRSRGQFEEPQRHYEKLEHVGDSVLGMIVTTWLHELNPGLTCGTATVGVSMCAVLTHQKLKAHLVSNATLSHISGMYNLPQRLNGDPRLLPVLRAQTDVRAALVEAYIAGIYFSYPIETRMTEGFACITAWLREMYDPLYDFFLQHMKNEYNQHYSVMGTAYDGTVEVAASPEELDRLDTHAEGMALLLKMYGTQRERRIDYDSQRFETSVGILWRIRCSVDGVEMGDATRSSRYRARNAAAWEAAKKLGLTTNTT